MEEVDESTGSSNGNNLVVQSAQNDEDADLAAFLGIENAPQTAAPRRAPVVVPYRSNIVENVRETNPRPDYIVPRFTDQLRPNNNVNVPALTVPVSRETPVRINIDRVDPLNPVAAPSIRMSIPNVSDTAFRSVVDTSRTDIFRNVFPPVNAVADVSRFGIGGQVYDSSNTISNSSRLGIGGQVVVPSNTASDVSRARIGGQVVVPSNAASDVSRLGIGGQVVVPSNAASDISRAGIGGQVYAPSNSITDSSRLGIGGQVYAPSNSISDVSRAGIGGQVYVPSNSISDSSRAGIGGQVYAPSNSITDSSRAGIGGQVVAPSNSISDVSRAGIGGQVVAPSNSITDSSRAGVGGQVYVPSNSITDSSRLGIGGQVYVPSNSITDSSRAGIGGQVYAPSNSISDSSRLGIDGQVYVPSNSIIDSSRLGIGGQVYVPSNAVSDSSRLGIGGQVYVPSNSTTESVRASIQGSASSGAPNGVMDSLRPRILPNRRFNTVNSITDVVRQPAAIDSNALPASTTTESNRASIGGSIQMPSVSTSAPTRSMIAPSFLIPKSASVTDNERKALMSTPSAPVPGFEPDSRASVMLPNIVLPNPDDVDVTKYLRMPTVWFLNVAMGVNALPLSEAFDSHNLMYLRHVETSDVKWDNELVRHLRTEVVAAASAVMTYTRYTSKNATMDDVIKYTGDVGAAYLGRIMTMFAHAMPNRNPTKENVIQSFWHVNVAQKYYDEKLERMPRNLPKRRSDVNPYMEFFSIALGMSGKPIKNAFGNEIPDESVTSWTYVKPYLSTDVAAAMMQLMLYVRRYRPKMTEDQVIKDHDVRYACARLMGRFMCSFESNSTHNGTTKTSTSLMHHHTASTLEVVQKLLTM